MAFLTISASSKNHHAYPHGLLEHSIKVTKVAVDTVKSYVFSEETM
ncbi:TraI domain-containing protein [Vibrio hangzhouensis]|nr:TraI domain-containing protein [Vibrio hangzhouensis]